MPTKTTSTPSTPSHPLAPPERKSLDGQSSAPAVALVAIVGLTYTFVVGTILGHVI
jgi:hypothetical protein